MLWIAREIQLTTSAYNFGDRLLKKSRYIPKRLVARVEQMEAEKVSVREILEVLISKGKRSQK